MFLVRGFVSNNLAPGRRPEWAEFRGRRHVRTGFASGGRHGAAVGKPKIVTPFLRRHGNFDDSLKDNNVAVLEYEQATAVLINTALQPVGTPPRSFEVLGTNGTAMLAPLEPPTLSLDLANRNRALLSRSAASPAARVSSVTKATSPPSLRPCAGKRRCPCRWMRNGSSRRPCCA